MSDLAEGYPTESIDNDREILLRLSAARGWVDHAENGDVTLGDAVEAVAALMGAAQGFLGPVE